LSNISAGTINAYIHFQPRYPARVKMNRLMRRVFSDYFSTLFMPGISYWWKLYYDLSFNSQAVLSLSLHDGTNIRAIC